MNFLAIDTSGRHLTVLAFHDGALTRRYLPDCALSHSVRLMDEIDAALAEAGMASADCDFFAAVVGPGSFTGIRIGIATVKGLCFGCAKPALAVTSFDVVAYAEESGPVAAVTDAGHGYVYLCAYDASKKIALSPRYVPAAEAEALRGEYRLAAAEPCCLVCDLLDPAEGLYRAVLARQGERCGADALSALYLRRSSAEERRQ